MKQGCLNCGNTIHGNFCNHCGQKADTKRLNIHFLWHEVQHGIIHLDKGICYTIKELFTRPGHSIREFLEGKRVRHFRPLMFLFVLAGIYGFIDHTFQLELISLPKNEFFGTAIQWATIHYSLAELIILPLFSLATWLAFRKWDYNYVEHIALNAFIAGQRIAISLLLIPVFYACKDGTLSEAVRTTGKFITLVFTGVVYIQFFNNHAFFYTVLRILLAAVYLILIALLLLIPAGFLLGR